jgi:SAM-dependent methyltransferase
MTSATSGFYERDGLHVAVYDAMHGAVPGGDELAFFGRLAAEAGGPVLELGCGTGRVSIPLAEAGFEVIGLDRSPAMLSAAASKRSDLPSGTRRRVRFVEGDMTDFRLGRRFGLVFAAFRVFMFLPDVAAQRTALGAIRRHLRPGGLLALDVFDPLLDRCVPGSHPPEERGEFVVEGRRIRVTAAERHTDPVAQRLRERWRFSELDPQGRVVREEFEELKLRWTYRHEMRHLLELAGFEPIAEYGDYAGSPPAYGREQIWVARRPEARR